VAAIGADGAAVLAEDLEAAEVDAFFGKTLRLFANLADALACRVIDVEGTLAAVVHCLRSVIDALAPRQAQWSL
jgi:hypothetical protein